ncbi:DUF4956 domain-containing protein [Planctomyces sp. SH-PL14]|uniref:DUF4956 domain-containing protein n=1 Tax=Planctomyces sp. SH-PL14 TaxID=1632864 RepID=UPI00078D7794|nr:DUF4956 domain-containing protein [Planctomyces sp. SH-PL14]AMV20794.1 hypothetical protein VT03_23030 [Planctomyces sp. SH-PL14]
MPEWLYPMVEAPHLPMSALLARLIFAIVGGTLVAGIYQRTRRASSIAPTFPATLVLLSVLIAVVTQVIGDNVARAFSLVGALSIVRFRTVVQDTKDTAFVIFAVVVGMSIGANQPVVAAGGIVAVGLTAWLFRDRPAQALSIDRQIVLEVKLGWVDDVEVVVRSAVAAHILDIEPLALSTLKNGAGLEARFRMRLLPSVRLTELVADLNRINGVQSVELRTE